jgi:hypothetical protein
MMETLLLGHSESLEEVDLEGCYILHRGDIADLLSRCKNLGKVIINGDERSDAVEYQDVVLQEWVCRDSR